VTSKSGDDGPQVDPPPKSRSGRLLAFVAALGTAAFVFTVMMPDRLKVVLPPGWTVSPEAAERAAADMKPRSAAQAASAAAAEAAKQAMPAFAVPPQNSTATPPPTR
jgi:hypothetical protein